MLHPEAAFQTRVNIARNKLQAVAERKSFPSHAASADPSVVGSQSKASVDVTTTAAPQVFRCQPGLWLH